jgi:hypothetical protein
VSLDLFNHLQIIRLRAVVQQHEAFKSAVVHHPFRAAFGLLLRPFKALLRRFRHYLRGRALAPLVVSNQPSDMLLEHGCFKLLRHVHDPQSLEIRIVSASDESCDANVSTLSNGSVRLKSGNRKLVIIHAYYEREAHKIFKLLGGFADYDLVLTTAIPSIRDEFLNRFDPQRAACLLVPNIGRDVLAFLLVVYTLDLSSYEYFVKVHTKRSGHLADGSNWFHINIETLIGNKLMTDRLFEHIDAGQPCIYGVECLPLQDHLENNRHWLEFLLKQPLANMDELFVPGTMFAGSVRFLKEVAESNFHLYQMEEEKGQLDGCLPHALERYFGYLAKVRGGECTTIENLVLRELVR